MWHEEQVLIDGELRAAEGGGVFETVNPATEEVLGVADMMDGYQRSEDPGVVNILTSAENSVGEVLTTNPDVDMVTFTGSTATGRKIIANNSIYGLSGSVNSADPERARAVARQIRSGTISVNGGMYYAADAPFGGYKQSGIGREMGVAGFEEFLEIKTLAEPAA